MPGEWTAELDFYGQMDEWLDLPGTDLQVMAIKTEPMGLLHLRKRPDASDLREVSS